MTKTKQRIIIIGPAHPYRGGIADTNEAMCRAFIRAGHDAEIITFSMQYPEFLFPGKTQYSTDPAPGDLKISRMINSLNPFNWISVASKIKSRKADVVIIRYWLPLMSPALGSIAHLIKGRVKVVGMTDNVIPHEKRALDSLFTKYFMSGCHAFMALSKSVKRDLESLTKKPSDYFPHPINDQLGDIVSKTEARQKLGLDLDQQYLLFFGFVRKYKGLDLLLNAMAEPALNSLHLKLIVAGEFYEDEAFYRDEINRLGLTDQVIIISDFIPASDVGLYFCACDLVSQTYRSATQSGITQMALHFEKPVLVTRVGGLDEFVFDNETGYFADVDAQSIAASIAKFFDGDTERMHESIKAQKGRFSWDEFVSRFETFVSHNLAAQ